MDGLDASEGRKKKRPKKPMRSLQPCLCRCLSAAVALEIDWESTRMLRLCDHIMDDSVEAVTDVPRVLCFVEETVLCLTDRLWVVDQAMKNHRLIFFFLCVWGGCF